MEAKYKKEKVEAEVEKTFINEEYGEVKVTRRYIETLREEAKKQKREEQVKTILAMAPTNVFIQEDWEPPDGVEIELFDEEDE